MTTDTPAEVAETATLRDAIDLRSITLIGLMGGQNGYAALLRSPRGRILKVTAGERAFGYTVTAIGETELLLANRSGATYRLAVPTH